MSSHSLLEPRFAPAREVRPVASHSESSVSSAPSSDQPPANQPAFLTQNHWRWVGWLAPAVVGLISGLLMAITGTTSWFASWPGLLVLIFAAGTAFTDTFWRKIPNWMTYPTVIGGLCIGLTVSLRGPTAWTGSLDFGQACFGFAACFCCMLVPYRASGGGAGDVKLAATYGALLGWQAGLSIIIMAYMVAGAALLLIHLSSSHPWLLPQALLRLFGSAWMPRLVDAPDEKQRQVLSRPIPLAGAFAAGLICVLCGGNLFAAY